MKQIQSKEMIKLIKVTLQENNFDYETAIHDLGQVEASKKRDRGEIFSFSDHLRGLILSMLSNQRPWGPIANNLEKISHIFYNYDKEKILKTEKKYFWQQLMQLKCGNRAVKKQMESLNANIAIMEKIENEFGSLDNYVSNDSPDIIAKELGNGKYKLKQIGYTLALEYLRNVGIKAVKPDVHIRRLLSNYRLNFSSRIPSEDEAVEIMKQLANESNVNLTYLDNLLWIFCATDYGNICNNNPKCQFCKLVNFCNVDLQRNK